MTARDLIDTLGGVGDLAGDLNLRYNRVHNWTRRGIPSRYWPEVVKRAQAIGGGAAEAVTFDALLAAHSEGRPARDAANKAAA